MAVLADWGKERCWWADWGLTSRALGSDSGYGRYLGAWRLNDSREGWCVCGSMCPDRSVGGVGCWSQPGTQLDQSPLQVAVCGLNTACSGTEWNVDNLIWPSRPPVTPSQYRLLGQQAFMINLRFYMLYKFELEEYMMVLEKWRFLCTASVKSITFTLWCLCLSIARLLLNYMLKKKFHCTQVDVTMKYH